MFQTQRVHPFPFRTRKLSFAVAKILAWRRAGKIVHRQHSLKWDIWLLRMSHFSVFRAKALQSPAHPAPPLTGPAAHKTCFPTLNRAGKPFRSLRSLASLCSSTEPRWYAKPASLCSSTELGRHIHSVRLPPYAHLLSFGGTRNLPPYAHTELGRHTKHASLCSTLS